MDSTAIARLERHFGQLQGLLDGILHDFYAILFDRQPELRPLFSLDLADQEVKLGTTLGFAIGHLLHRDLLDPMLRALGARHVGYGVERRHYPMIRDALLAALATHSVDWTDQLAEDWGCAIDLISEVMLEGAGQ